MNGSKMRTETNIMIAGVGGQGTLLASRIIGAAAIQMDFDVKVSEVHGMSQRGGSVVTYVRYSNRKVYAPIITEGSADIILAFELLEGYRMLPFLKAGKKLVVNTQKIKPMPVITGAAAYPEDIIKKMNQSRADILSVDALALASEAGSAKAVNVVLIGILARFSDIPKEVWQNALTKTVPSKFIEINKKAFELGYTYN